MPTFITRTFLALSLIILVGISDAHAIEINDAGAERLKAQLTEQIEHQRKMVKSSGGNIISDGDITIEQGDGYYAATMPATTYKTVTGQSLKIGLVAINAIPTDNPNDWKMSIAVPTPILMTDETDELIQRIDIGAQKMGGLWSGKLGNFSKINAQYDNLKVTMLPKNEGFDIGKAVIKSNLEEKGNNIWGGPTNIAISNFSANSPTTQNIFSIKEILAVINIDKFEPEKQKLAAVKLQSPNNKDVSGSLMNILKSSGNVTTKFSAKDITVNDPNAPDNLKGIDLIQFGYNSKTPTDNKVDQEFNFAYQGLTFKDKAKINPLIPTQFKTSITLEKFPLLEVMNFVENTIDKNQDSSARQVAATKAMNFLPQKLKDAGTMLLIKNTNFGNNDYDVKIDSEIKATPASQMGGIGKLNIETKGLDKIMKALETIPSGSMIAQQLAMFRMMSEEKGDKNIAHIALDEQGKITINDKDISALMGGGAPAQ